MEMNTVEVMNRGMQCLVDHLGIIGAEHFIWKTAIYWLDIIIE